MYFARLLVSLHNFNMRQLRNSILLGVLLVCWCGIVRAQDSLSTSAQESIPLRFSVLTCTPGTDAYAHFGHTAILLEDTVRKQNAVFNYGCFDDSQKFFILNFVAGNTNYLLEAETLGFFLWRYSLTGNGVCRQELNLTPKESQRLLELLAVNMRKENQTYLYNWLYDNCTERARDIIEKAIDGTVVYEKKHQEKTVRTMLHEKLQNAPWLQLGIDIILGSEIDQNVDKRIQMFMPDFYESELNEAFITDGQNEKRPLIKNVEIMQEPTELSKEVASPLNPTIAFSIMLAIAVCISAFDITKNRLSLWFDILMLLAQGITGIVVAGLFFFSKHPAVDSNWMVIAFNPLYIVLAIYLVYNWKTGNSNQWRIKAEYANMAVLIAFYLTSLLTKQWFNPVVYIMVSALQIRSGVRVNYFYKQMKKNLKNK